MPAEARLKGPALLMFRPPPPLPKLRIHRIDRDRFQRIEGGADEDLLLVAPPEVVDGRVRLEVNGFRGIYLIGATFDPKPHGRLVSPNGKRVEGIGALLKLRTHGEAINPFIYLSRIEFRANHVRFGDWLQVGGSNDLENPQFWPDVYRFMIKADALYGWRGYSGGNLSPKTSHSDFFKMEMGGVRHSFAAHIHARFGYQHEYAAASWKAKFKPYRDDDGVGNFHYFNYLAELAEDPGLGATDRPVAFFLARSSHEVSNGNAYRFIFHDGEYSGLGVAIRPGGGENDDDRFAEAVHPMGGSYAPLIDRSGLSWPKSPEFALGRIERIEQGAPWPILGTQDVGFSHRIANRSELETMIEQWHEVGIYGPLPSRSSLTPSRAR